MQASVRPPRINNSQNVTTHLCGGPTLRIPCQDPRMPFRQTTQVSEEICTGQHTQVSRFTYPGARAPKFLVLGVRHMKPSAIKFNFGPKWAKIEGFCTHAKQISIVRRVWSWIFCWYNLKHIDIRKNEIFFEKVFFRRQKIFFGFFFLPKMRNLRIVNGFP